MIINLLVTTFDYLNDYRSFGIKQIHTNTFGMKQTYNNNFGRNDNDYNHFDRIAQQKKEAAMLLGIPIVEAVQHSGNYNRYVDPFDYVNNLQPINLNTIKQKDGSIVVEAYYDPYKQLYYLIYKNIDETFSYLIKDKNFNIVVKRTNLVDIEQVRNEMKCRPSSIGAIDGRWSGEIDMYIKSHFKPVKIEEHELNYYPNPITKKSFFKQIEEEVSNWCKGILNVV